MTEKDMNYLHSLFANWELATINRYRKEPFYKRTELPKHLKRLDDLKKKIVLQNELVLNSLAFRKDKK